MESHTNSAATYWLVFVALLLLTGATTAVAFIDLGPLNAITALAIAGVKAALVGAFFMHMRQESKLIITTATAGGLWLLLLIGLTVMDYLHRS